MNHLRMNVALLELFRKFIRFGRVSLPEVGWIGWDWVVSVPHTATYCCLSYFKSCFQGTSKFQKCFLPTSTSWKWPCVDLRNWLQKRDRYKMGKITKLLSICICCLRPSWDEKCTGCHGSCCKNILRAAAMRPQDLLPRPIYKQQLFLLLVAVKDKTGPLFKLFTKDFSE